MFREHGVFSTAHAADLALDICDQLAGPHGSGVVHGQLGLRCVRLVMSREDGPREVDVFALTADDDGELEMQALPLLAPEQRELSGPIDGRADLWAIGAIVHQVVLGVPPTNGVTGIGSEVHAALPSSFARIIEACLAVDPAARPATIDELTEKLASFATWPPDRFARLAERREAKARAARAQEALAARGLSAMPAVLDKLDEAAIVRATRASDPVPALPGIATMASILDRPASRAALDRLLAVVKEGTEASRLEHAAELPDLVDDADDDDELRTVLKEPDPPLPSVILRADPVASPLERPSLPASLPELLAAPLSAPPVARAAAATSRRARRRALPVVALVGGAFVVSLAVGYGGYRLTATPPTPAPAAPIGSGSSAAPLHAAAATTTTTANVTGANGANGASAANGATTAGGPMIPTFSANALPEAAPITPSSLPDAKR